MRSMNTRADLPIRHHPLARCVTCSHRRGNRDSGGADQLQAVRCPQLLECTVSEFQTRVDDPQTPSSVPDDLRKVGKSSIWKVYAIEEPLVEFGEVAWVHFARI